MSMYKAEQQGTSYGYSTTSYNYSDRGQIAAQVGLIDNIKLTISSVILAKALSNANNSINSANKNTTSNKTNTSSNNNPNLNTSNSKFKLDLDLQLFAEKKM